LKTSTDTFNSFSVFFKAVIDLWYICFVQSLPCSVTLYWLGNLTLYLISDDGYTTRFSGLSTIFETRSVSINDCFLDKERCFYSTDRQDCFRGLAELALAVSSILRLMDLRLACETEENGLFESFYRSVLNGLADKSIGFLVVFDHLDRPVEALLLNIRSVLLKSLSESNFSRWRSKKD